MIDYKLGEVEMRFATLIWEHEPLASGELVKLAQEALAWKKPTTYSILRKLCEKGIFQNQQTIVTSLVTKEAYMAMQSQRFVAESFDGSLPHFVAAFVKRQKLSEKEIQAIQQLIDEQTEVEGE